MVDPKTPPTLQETAAAREAARDKEREWDRRAEARDVATPRTASEDGLNFHVWHVDSVGQADRFDGTFSSLLDAQARVERTEATPTSVWVSEAEAGYHFYVAEGGLVTALIDERSVGSPFQDRLYAARGQHAVPGGAPTVDTPNALVPRPSEEVVAAARAKKAERTVAKPKTDAELKREREEAAKREGAGHVGGRP